MNVVGPISMTRMLVPYMLKRGRGHLVVVSRIIRGAAKFGDYSYLDAIT